ncbi:hypothetical protein AAMO2058_000850000 [Amorphochlora amoebiformis]
MAMQSAAYQKLHPREYYKKFLEHGIRPDGRGLMDVRRTAVSLGSIKTADGSALAKVGGTTVACGLKLEVGIPSALKPKEGRFEVSLKLASLCSPEINKKSLGRTFVGNDKRIDAMAATIKKTIASSQMMNLEELCIKEGASVWVVYIDLVCVDFSGNIFDAALMVFLSRYISIAFTNSLSLYLLSIIILVLSSVL